jgi:uncharacterized membrane protein (UPF0136 family)
MPTHKAAATVKGAAVGQVPAARPATVADVLHAVDILMKIFRMERILYLAFGIASFILFCYVGYRTSLGQIQGLDMAALLGSTGVTAACSGRVVFFLNKAFNIIECVLTGKPQGGEQP